MMRRFVLQRNEDVHGVSGTGVVAEGVEFTNGTIALSWLTPTSSMGFYANARCVEEIHGHEGRTVMVWEEEDA